MADAYCTVEDVKQRQSGDVPTNSDAFDLTMADAIAEVSDLINEEVRNVRGQGEGWSFLPGTRTTSRYTGKGAPLVLIDDSLEVISVAILDPMGNVIQTLVAGQDYLPYPLNGLPIVGLTRTSGVWPSYAGGVQVDRVPGYAYDTPPNVRKATIEEVIRAIRAGQAGVDDRLGMTPYGTLVVSKALLASTLRTCQRYRFGGGFMR
jgi:hypothetical protein